MGLVARALGGLEAVVAEIVEEGGPVWETGVVCEVGWGRASGKRPAMRR